MSNMNRKEMAEVMMPMLNMQIPNYTLVESVTRVGITLSWNKRKLTTAELGFIKEVCCRYGLVVTEEVYVDEDGDDERGRPIRRSLYSYHIKNV